ncbi:MAG: M23 family metallopeptidase [Eubacteriales bacterium]|nr:M23 family metallopeptidase [Eubacteriales bacterium]
MKRVSVFLCALLLLCGGCVPAAQQAPALTPPARLTAAAAMPAVPPTPAPTPNAPDAGEIAQSLRALWEQTLELDIAPFLPPNFFDAEAPWQIFGTTAEERAWLPALEASIQEQLLSALTRTAARFSATHGDLSVTAAQTTEAPSWQLLYALLQGCASEAEANALLVRAVSFQTAIALSAPGKLSYRISVRPLAYREALRLPGGEEGAYWSRCFTYSYLYTVFGRDAAEIDYELPPASGCLSDGILWPLQSHIKLRKTWYADRDGGKRKHTGTDIWAEADTEIYSCTDGVVSYVGSGAGTGYAVIVTDKDGYQFHYYHMIRLSDFLRPGDTVQAGACIGRVGNTGNSDRDHLHLTIVAPDGKYIDPYPYLRAVKP